MHLVESHKDNQKIYLNSKRILVSLCAIGTILILAWVIKYSHYGIDFTDESYYLVWISNPFLYDWSLSQFGYIYHPLYVILGGDIANIRQANILITFSLSWCVALLFLKSLAPKNITEKITLHVTAAGLATTSLIAFDTWLTTPSYNSLAFQAVLITSIGMLMSEKDRSSSSLSGWILIGIGGWLSLMAKPSTALALATGVLVYLLIARKFSIRMLLLAVVSALALLLASAILIDGSIYKFAARLSTGVQLAAGLGSRHTLMDIIRLDSFQLGLREKLALLLLAVASFFATYLVSSKNIIGIIFSLLISALFFCIIALLSLGVIQRTAGFSQLQGLIIWGVVFSTLAVGIFCGRKKILTIPAAQLGIGLLFFAMPHIYAFGTNGNYWQAGSSASIFWLLGGLVLLSPTVCARQGWWFAIPLVLASQAVTVMLLQTGLEQPYRQTQPLRLNNTLIEIGATGSNLVLSTGYAKYLEDAKKAAQNANFNSDTPVIDLTGQSPGILYALKAENIGQAWTVGGYPGSLKVATIALNRTSCKKIAAAWVLFEPDGPRNISTEIMLSQGADFPKNYRRMGIWLTAEGAGGYAESRVQVLYAPVAQQVTLEACQALHKRKTP